MPPDTASIADGDWALFLDVDGTLLEIAATPQGVRVSARLRALLAALRDRTEGALALISGRSLEDLDRLFAPLELHASGTHGCEFRCGSGEVTRPNIDPAVLAHARAELDALVVRHEGLLLEDKAYSLAVHFRLAPHLGAEVHAIMRVVAERLGDEFTLQRGKSVYEIRPARWSKGSAIARFMERAPFRERKSLFIGDDVTDEHGFAVVNSLGGASIKVGNGPTLARYRVPDVAAVLTLLEQLPDLSLVEAAS
jgi:trehalose 6-phosphate phosphatase